MFKKSLSLLLAGWMLSASSAPYAIAQPSHDPQSRHAAKIKAAAQRLRARDERVKLELYNKTKLSGSIGEIGEDQFVLRESNTGNPIQVAYSSVKNLRGSGPSLAKIILFGPAAYGSKTGLIVLAVLLGGLIALVSSDKS